MAKRLLRVFSVLCILVAYWILLHNVLPPRWGYFWLYRQPTGTLILKKTPVQLQQRLGIVEEMQLINGNTVLLQGSDGAGLMDLRGQFQAIGPSKYAPGRLVIGADQQPLGYLTGGWYNGKDLAFLDLHGRPRWSYSTKKQMTQTSVEDMNGDGQPEILVSVYALKDSLRLLNLQGKELWRRQEADILLHGIADVNRDGKQDIIYGNREYNLVIRDWTGKLLSRRKIRRLYSSYTLCQWPSAQSPWALLQAKEHLLQFYNLDGQRTRQWLLPQQWRTYSKIMGIPVRLQPDKPPYFAVAFNRRVHDGDASYSAYVLLIYNKAGAVVYQTTAQYGGQAKLLAIPSTAHPHAQDLLLGDDLGTVTRFTFVKEQPVH